MENKKIQQMFANAIIKDGFSKYLTYGFMKHVTNDDMIQIHIQVFEHYKMEISNKTIVFNKVIKENLHTLMEHFIEVEDYERCIVLRDQITTLESKFNFMSV